MPDRQPSWDQVREVGTFRGQRVLERRCSQLGRPPQLRLLVQRLPTDEAVDLLPELAGNTTRGRVSPDGLLLAFLHNVAQGFWPWYAVGVLDEFGQVREPLGHDLWVAGGLYWSPDGKLVVEVREGVRLGLLAIDVDCGQTWWLLRPQGFLASNQCQLSVATWRSKGAALEGVLATPAEGKPPFPLVVDIHGGPSFSLLATRMPPLHHWTARGFAAFAPEYRASGIAGRAAMEAAAEWKADADGGTDLTDVLDGVQEVVDRGVADPERLFLYGFSYGAVLVNRLVTIDGRFKAAVSHEGVADLALLRDLYGPDNVPTGRGPIERVAAVTTPLLLVSGSAAPNRPQAEAFAAALTAAGKTVALEIVEGEGHELRRPDNIAAMYDLGAAWFRVHDK